MTPARTPVPPATGGLLVDLSPAWQDWLVANVARGCRDDDLLAVLSDNDFDPKVARATLALARRVLATGTSARAAAPGASTVRHNGPLALPAGARVEVDGHVVQVGLALREPGLALLLELLSARECAELIACARGRLQPSEVIDRASGRSEVSGVRSSEGTHFALAEVPVVAALERRIEALTGLPAAYGEPLQILRYAPGGEYLAHHDFFDPADPGSAPHLARGGQRVATIVLYLNAVEEGGATAFPELALEVRPQAGNAVFFEYTGRAGLPDARCLHAGLPVVRGEKWIATKWLRAQAYCG